MTTRVSNLNNFNPLEVVDRGSETQFQVGGNLKVLIKCMRDTGTTFS